MVKWAKDGLWSKLSREEKEEIVRESSNLDNLLTEQDDDSQHKDGLWGRVYTGGFDYNQLGRAGNNEIINVQRHGDHYDVIEWNVDTRHVYHNRIKID